MFIVHQHHLQRENDVFIHKHAPINETFFHLLNCFYCVFSYNLNCHGIITTMMIKRCNDDDDDVFCVYLYITKN